MAPDDQSRLRATRILEALLSDRGSLASHLTPDDTPMTRELCYGCCRWYHLLSACLDQLMDRPLKARDQDIRALLLTGLYQLHFMRVPAHAAVNETVAATRTLDKPWAKGLVNAVLRSFQRQADQLLPAVREQPGALHSHPDWLIRRLQKAWPDHWQAVLQANNSHPPMTLRVNTQQQDRASFLERLHGEGMEAAPGQHADTAIYLDRPLAADRLPGFSQGSCSIQDEASQLVAGLLALAPGLRVLDACAAPGGKAALLLEQQPALELLALDIEQRRLERVRENLERCGLQARVVCADALDRDAWWDGRRFDRILLDAPCSASGIIRRQPDIKLLRRDSDIRRLCRLQQQLLEAVWPTLEPGGLLLYTTCSVLPEENSRQVARFLAAHPEARDVPIEAEWGLAAPHGRQLLPAAGEPDGFFYALLRKDELACIPDQEDNPRS